MWRLDRGHRERTRYGDMGWYYVAGLSFCIMLAMMVVPGHGGMDEEKGRVQTAKTPEKWYVPVMNTSHTSYPRYRYDTGQYNSTYDIGRDIPGVS